MDFMKEYEKWLASPALSDAERAELESIRNDPKEIESRFYGPLEFGTAGLRGIMAVGLHNMNIHVIRWATQGFAQVICAEGEEGKRRGVAIREAFNQINRYQRDSFWAGCGLFEYVQIFVISNGTNTKYYSNSTRYNAIREASSGKAKKQKTSNSFEFTSFWADANNKVIPDLIDFTRTFFAKHTILNVLTRYCIFTSENMLMVMRPYQITATERILNRIEIANNYKKYGFTSSSGLYDGFEDWAEGGGDQEPITSYSQLGTAAKRIADGASRGGASDNIGGLAEQIETYLNRGEITDAEADFLLRAFGY